MDDTTSSTTGAMVRRIEHAPAQTPSMQPANIDEAMRLAEILSKSDMVPDAYRGKPPNILIAVMRGRELGWGAMQSMALVHVVKGRVVLSADAMVGLVKRHPECVFFHLVRSTTEAACYQTQRAGEPGVTEMEFTIADAQRAGLTSSQTWKSYPAAMLRARCSAALARAVYPDVLAGCYETDEGREIARSTARTTPVDVSQPDILPPVAMGLDEQIAEAEIAEVPQQVQAAPKTGWCDRIDACTTLDAVKGLGAEMKAALDAGTIPAEAAAGLRAALLAQGKKIAAGAK